MTNVFGIDVRNVSVHRGERSVLSDLNLTIERGQLVAMVGLNGAGKTTLLSLLATLVRPSAGQIVIDGIDAIEKPDQVRSRIGVVFQESALEPRLSARDNLSFIARCQGLRGNAARRRTGELLEILGLAHLAATPVQRLSGGQRRRLELARALIARPPVLLLDEATLGLDVAAQHAFWSEVRALIADGHTVLCSTHHTSEAREANRVVALHEGRLLADGTWRTLCEPVPSLIRLWMHHGDRALPWLAQHGYSARLDDESIVVTGSKPRTMLPALLAHLPWHVHAADVIAPELKDLVAHWIAARCNGASSSFSAVSR